MANVSAFTGAMPVIPGGTVELGYAVNTASQTNITGTSFPATQSFIGPTTIVTDGSPLLVEFFAAEVRPPGAASGYVTFSIFVDGAERTRYFGVLMNESATPGHKPVHLARRLDNVTAGSHTVEIRVVTSVTTNTPAIYCGTDAATNASAPAFLRVSKIVNQNDGLKPFWTPPVVTQLPSQATEGDQVLLRYAATGGGQGLWTYNSGAWRPEGGLHLIQKKTTTGGSTSISFDGVFTSLFDSYRVTFSEIQSNQTNISFAFRLRANGTDNSGATNYKYGGSYRTWSGAAGDITSAGASSGYLASGGNNGVPFAGSYDIYNPKKSWYTSWVGTASNFDAFVSQAGVHTVGDPYDGFTIYPNAGTISNSTGIICVYGYAKETSA